MKVKVNNIGIAERQVIGAVLNEVAPSKANRALVRNIRHAFNIGGLRDEVNRYRSMLIQKKMDETLSDNLKEVLNAAIENSETETPLSDETREAINEAVERIVRTVAGPHVLQSVQLSWEDALCIEPETATFEVDKTDLKVLRKHYDDKKEWAWDDKKEAVPPPSALHEALANLDEALENALKEQHEDIDAAKQE